MDLLPVGPLAFEGDGRDATDDADEVFEIPGIRSVWDIGESCPEMGALLQGCHQDDRADGGIFQGRRGEFGKNPLH